MKHSFDIYRRLFICLAIIVTYPGLQIPLYDSNTLAFGQLAFIAYFICVLALLPGNFFIKFGLSAPVPLFLFLSHLTPGSDIGIAISISYFLFAYIGILALISYVSAYPNNTTGLILLATVTVACGAIQLDQFFSWQQQRAWKAQDLQYTAVIEQIHAHHYADPQSIFATCASLGSKDSQPEIVLGICASALAQSEKDPHWCDQILDERTKFVSCYLPSTYSLPLEQQISFCNTAKGAVREECLETIVSNRPGILEEQVQQICELASPFTAKQLCYKEWEWRKKRGN